MTRKNQIRTLGDHALAELANVIVHAVGQENIPMDMAVMIVQINEYLSNLGATSDIYQDLLRVILCSDSLEASIRFTCLQMLLNESVQCLVTEIFPFSYYEKILQVIAAQGRGLKCLNLKGVWVKEEHMFYMFEIVQRLPNLKKLSIPYIANDELLEQLAKHCKHLKYLDIAGETDITEIGIEFLCYGLSKEKLTVIDIGMLREENICHEDIALLLQNCPNLVNLVTYSFVGKSILHIFNKNPNFKCRLRYIHDTETKGNALDAIIACCPYLESLYMDTPEIGILHKLKHLKLQRLKLYKFCCQEFTEIFQTIGKNLLYLTVIKGRGVLNLGNLARWCPGMIDLDCYLMELLIYSCDYSFNALQGLEILNSSMALSSLKHFISNSNKLKRLAVDTVHFTDEDITSLFLENDFFNLEDIWFTSAPNLTIASVEILMERCPELQSLGQLSGWALTPDDLTLLRGILKSGNLGLVLSPSSIFP